MRPTEEEDIVYGLETGDGGHKLSRFTTMFRAAAGTTTTPEISTPRACSCGCCSIAFSVLVLIVSLSCFITAYSLWGHVIAGSTELTGMATRVLGLQGHYTFTGIVGSTGQTVAGMPTIKSTATVSTTTPVAILHGWVDMHAQRTDWNVVLFQDTFGLFLNPNPSGRFCIWAKLLNETSHVLEHTAGSPWFLEGRTGSKTGAELPAFLRQPPNKPLFYEFVIQSSLTTWSVPLYSPAP